MAVDWKRWLKPLTKTRRSIVAFRYGNEVHVNPMHVDKMRGSELGIVVKADMYCPPYAIKRLWIWEKA